MIICGYNKYTRHLEGKFIDVDVPDGKNFFRGDPTDIETLKKAGIEEEDTIIVAMEDDVKNLYIALMAKKINPKIRVIVILKSDEYVENARSMGIDQVMLESEIIGREIIKSLLSPIMAEMTTRIGVSEIMNIYAAPLPEIYYKKRLRDTDIRRRFGTVIAIKRGKRVIKNPTGDLVLEKGDILIFLRGRK